MPRLPGLHLPICPPFFNNQLAIRDAARTTNSWRIGVGKLMAPWTPKGTDNHHWGSTAAQLHRTTNSPPHTTDTSSTTHKCRRALLLQGRVACFFFYFFYLVAFSFAAPTSTFPPHFPHIWIWLCILFILCLFSPVWFFCFSPAGHVNDPRGCPESEVGWGVGDAVE